MYIDIIYIYSYFLPFKDVQHSPFTFSPGDKLIFAAELAMPPQSNITLLVRGRKKCSPSYFGWYAWLDSPCKFSKTFRFNGIINCEQCLCQFKCALTWLWVQHFDLKFDQKSIPGLKLRDVHFVLSLDFKCFLTYSFIQNYFSRSCQSIYTLQ